MLVAAGILAGLVAAGLAALSLADALTATGLPDPGPVTTVGLPFVRAAGEVAAAAAVGGLLFAAFFVPPQDSGVLDVAGYRAVRLAAGASGVWTVCAAALVPLTISDVSGKSLRDLDPDEIWRVAGLVATASAWRWTAALAFVVTVAARAVLRWSWTPVLFGVSLLSLVPLALTGHSAAGGSHQLATYSLLIHLAAGAMWAGGLLALLANALIGGGHTGLAARRFSAVALGCFVAMTLSGIVNVLIRLRLPELVTTRYGWLVIAKVLALLALGVIGWWQRGRAVVVLRDNPDARTPLIRLATAEALVFGATFGIAVGLGRTPPPPPPGVPPAAEVAAVAGSPINSWRAVPNSVVDQPVRRSTCR